MNSLFKAVDTWLARLDRVIRRLQAKTHLLAKFQDRPLRVRPEQAAYTPASLGLLALLVIAFVGLRLWGIASYSLWAGDNFVLKGLHLGWPGVFYYMVEDIVHPPLIYLVIRVGLALGAETLLWLKLLPALFTISSLTPFWLLCRELNLRPTEINLALTLMAFNGFLVHYAQGTRNYFLLLFLGLCSMWLFVRYYNRPHSVSGWSLFGVNLILVYSHYFGWLLVGVQWITLLLWRRPKLPRFSRLVAGLVILAAPWFAVVAVATVQKEGLGSNLGWIGRPGPASVINLLADFNGEFGTGLTKIAGLLLMGLPVLGWGWQVVRQRAKNGPADHFVFLWLTLLIFGTLTGIFLVSWVLPQAFWIDRYFIFIAPPYMILVALAVLRLPRPWLRFGAVGLVAAWAILAGLNDLYTYRVAWTNPQIGSRLDWETLAVQLSTSETSPDGPVRVYSVSVWSEGIESGNWSIANSIDYYLHRLLDRRFEFLYGGSSPANLLKILSQADPPPDHFWVAFFELGDTNNEQTVINLLSDHGYRLGPAIRDGHLANQVVFLPVWRD